MRTRLQALLALLVLAVLAGCTNATEPGSTAYESLPADNVLMGVDHVVTVDGVRRSVLRADTTLGFTDSSTVHLRGVNLQIFADDGQLRATLTSLTGELNQGSNRMVARGNVVLVVRGEQGRTVWTEELHYDPQQKRIWSDVRTRTRTDRGEELEGEGFSSDEEFRNFQIERPRGTGLRIEF